MKIVFRIRETLYFSTGRVGLLLTNLVGGALWYLQQMVTQKQVRVYRVKFDLFKAFVYIESSHKSRKIPFFLHMCATCAEIPSNIRTMMVVQCGNQTWEECMEQNIFIAVLDTLMLARTLFPHLLNLLCSVLGF